jgi:hypothetical protein
VISLQPTQFPHRPRCIPHFDHAGNFVLIVHGQEVDIVGMGLFVRRRDGAAFAGVFGMIGGKEDGGVRLLVIRGGMEVIGRAWGGARF